MKLTENAMTVLTNRSYLQRDAQGNVAETPEDMTRRVAKKVASAEETDELKKEWEQKFYENLDALNFMASTPILMNLGTKKIQHGSACHVLGIDDTRESIFGTLYDAAMIFAAGGGVGYNFGKLRSAGSVVKTAGGHASGPVSFMELYNALIECVRQGGGRRGAAMACLNVWHPDVIEFIKCKTKEGKLSNFNISVMLSDEFMEAVEKDAQFTLVDPHDARKKKKVRAKEIFDLIATQAWKNGEPGVLFHDAINRANTNPHLGSLDATNPCCHPDTELTTPEGQVKIIDRIGQPTIIWNGYEWSTVVPKHTGENLPCVKIGFSNGSYLIVTLYHTFYIYKDGRRYRCEAQDLKVSDNIFGFTTPDGTYHENIFIDSIEDYGIVPDVYCFNEPIRHTAMFNGIMTGQCGEISLRSGGSCLLASINLSNYVKDKAIDFDGIKEMTKIGIRFLDNVITIEQHPNALIEKETLASRDLGLGIMGFADLLTKIRVSYNSDKAIQIANDIMKTINETAIEYSSELGKEKGSYPAFEGSTWAKKYKYMRNGTHTCIAPTGSISMICNVSSGCEPLFRLAYNKNVLPDADGNTTSFYYGNDELINVLKEAGIYSERLIQKVAETGTLTEIDGLPQWIKDIFITANEIPASQHILMQSAFQNNLSQNTSKTINMPITATVEDVKNAYMQAWKLNLKGLTLYRNGSRTTEVLTAPVNNKKDESSLNKDETNGITRKMKTTGCGTLLVFMNYAADGRLGEVIPMLGKSGGCTRCIMEALGRVMSVGLRKQLTPEDIVDQLSHISCPKPTTKMDTMGEASFTSCPDAIAQAVAARIGKSVASIVGVVKDKGATVCPKCGNIMEKDGGCEICKVCGTSGGCS